MEERALSTRKYSTPRKRQRITLSPCFRLGRAMMEWCPLKFARKAALSFLAMQRIRRNFDIPHRYAWALGERKRFKKVGALRQAQSLNFACHRSSSKGWIA